MVIDGQPLLLERAMECDHGVGHKISSSPETRGGRGLLSPT